MLIIPEETKSYFLKVQQWAEDHNLFEIFQMSMLAAHLYGCSWEDQERTRVYLHPDSIFNSFSAQVEERTEQPETDKDVTYVSKFTGGLIYLGPKESEKVLDMLQTVPYQELMSNLGWRIRE